MNFMKYFLILMMFFLVACVETKQINGIRFNKIKNFNIEIGKTSKSSLINEYGPPSFESPFKKSIIYYTSQNTVYKNLSAPQVEKMILYQVYLDKNGMVTKFKKYNEKDIVNLEIMNDGKEKKENTLRALFKQMINNLQRRNLEN
jgi:outer membrane protein assembly factor BamE (lipoprotein component of BamABCDE complex)